MPTKFDIKAVAFDGSSVNRYLKPLPCGGTPCFDDDSGMSYRCDICGAVVGSMGMPKYCYEAWQKEKERKEIWEKLSKKGPGLKPDNTWSDLS